MTIRKSYNESEIYFCTFTCIRWLHLIEITNLYDHIYNWFKILIRQGHEITGFVIMPNHVHLLVHVDSTQSTVNRILSNGKRFMAYEIIKRLGDLKQYEILQTLSQFVSTEERKRQKKHRVFEPSSDIKPCFTEKFINQKLEYIHANPVTGKWQLAASMADFQHSSASFYELNQEHSLVHITHHKELKIFELSAKKSNFKQSSPPSGDDS